jgi:hypothetical protein
LQIKTMNKPNIKQHLRRTFSVLAMIGALMALPSAQAARPMSASGTFTVCLDVPDVHTVGNVTVIVRSETITLTGTLNGTVTGTEELVIYPNGNLNVSISGTFTGTVSGQSGTVQFNAAGTIAQGNGTGAVYWVIGQGTLGLAGLHGQGTFGPPTFLDPTEQCPGGIATGDYSGQIQFAQ